MSSSIGLLLSDMRKYRVLTADEMLELFKKYRETHDLDIRRKLFNHNLRLVVRIAKGLCVSEGSLEDAIQDGAIGLWHAIDLFDPDLGFTFSTYATGWIRSQIYKSRCVTDFAVKIPTRVMTRGNAYRRYLSKYAQEHGGFMEPSDQEVAQALRCDISEAVEVRLWFSNVVSLDKSFGEDNDLLLSDIIEGDRDVSSEADEDFLQMEVQDALSVLTDSQRFVIEKRFGFGNDRPHTLNEVGKMLGIQREAVRKLEERALRRLRHPKTKKKLEEYYVG